MYRREQVNMADYILMASAMGLAEIGQYSETKLLNDMHILHILLIQKWRRAFLYLSRAEPIGRGDDQSL